MITVKLYILQEFHIIFNNLFEQLTQEWQLSLGRRHDMQGKSFSKVAI